MLPGAITTMLDTLARGSGPGAQADQMKRFGRALLHAPDDAAQLLAAIAGSPTAGAREERMSRLLSSALDEARMARENGQKLGADFIAAMDDRLGQLVAAGGMPPTGRLAASSSWVRAGLTPPESLAMGRNEIADARPDAETEEREDLGSVFERLFGSLMGASEGTVSDLHAMFAEMLPTVPPDARYALIRTAVSQPAELLAELGCTWLLDPAAEVRSAAADGLADRLEAGRLSADILARLAVVRSWLADDALKERLEGLLRLAMRKGIGRPGSGAERTIHRIVASMVDGSGAQSMAAAVRSGGARSVAVLLLKQGFGVKDAYVLPCASATEQRGIVAGIVEEIDAYDVSRDYLAQAIGHALSEGLETGTPPAPGLVDVAQVCGLTELRPDPAAVGDILARADPEGRIAGLSAQARGRLIAASRHWSDRFSMLSSWFEDDDRTAETLDSATSRAALTRGLWNVLETRREHWARIIARNALLLKAAGEDHADEFTAVAAALIAGRDLKKIPVMQLIFEQSIEAWAHRQDERVDMAWGPEPARQVTATATAAPADAPVPDLRPEKAGELAKLLQPAGLSEPWLDGYLTGVCTAPRFVSPPDWIGPLLHLVGPTLKGGKKLERFVDLLMRRYNATLSRLRAPAEAGLVPAEIPLIPIWSDGYLTAWEANKPHWPAKALGPQGKAMRKLLENATDGRIDSTGFASTLPAWLRQRFADQGP